MESPGERTADVDALAAWRRWLGKGSGRWLGMLVGAVFTAAILLPDPGPLPPLRFWAFDSYQLLLPRTYDAGNAPTLIVQIDDESLRRVGQWPWPRDIVARLIDRIAEQQPAAIGIDILFTEPDRSSPDRVADSVSRRDPEMAQRLASLRPTNDEILAKSIADARAVIGVAGVNNAIARGQPYTPARIRGETPPQLPVYQHALRSLPSIDHYAAGHGLLNADPERGIVRRVPLAAQVGGEPVLTLALECFRVAAKLTEFNLHWNRSGLRSVQIGDLDVQAQANGRAWIHFSPHDGRRYLSAADVLGVGNSGEARSKQLERLAELKNRIVLLGVTALATLDQNTTARGERMSGIEIHAQLIENIVEGALLARPFWGRYVEAFMFVLAAGLFIFVVPRTRPMRSALVMIGCWTVFIGGGVAAYYFTRTLFDPGTPLVGVTLLYGSMLSATLVTSERQRRLLSARLASEREAAARVTGELEAAQRIQTGMLPTRESVLRNERRLEIFAYMKAAREVGGDLYDFFPLSPTKFMVIVGDVSGKGLPASIFMAVSKALAKSCSLRAPETATPAELMVTFNEEISRDNPEQLFVTVVALIMDLQTGEVVYCNAGHEPPILVRRTGESLTLDDGGGPPLCVVDDFPYEEGRAKLEPRDLLAITSDGLTEAMNRSGAIYGRARLKAMLDLPTRRDVDVTILGHEILAGIKNFESGAEPADDQTLLLVSWRGPA